MLLALTGTPGTGKSRTVSILEKRGYRTVDLNATMHAEGLIETYEAEYDAYVPDLDALDAFLQREYASDSGAEGEWVVIDGHLSHLLRVDLIIVLRAAPSALAQRLAPRGYTEDKIRENLEAEAVDTILIEALKRHNERDLFEIDTTDRAPEAVADTVEAILRGDAETRAQHRPGRTDWSEEVLAWY